MTQFVLFKEPLPLKFPATFADVRKANPNVSLPFGSTLESLDTETLELLGAYEVTLEAQPSYNPSTEKVVLNTPVQDVEGNWSASYSIVALSEEELESLKPLPDFAGFQSAALTTPAFQAMITNALPTATLACLSLPALFSQVIAGGPTDSIVIAMNQIVEAGNPSQEDLAQFIQAAEFFNLPEDLIDQILRVYLDPA